MKKSNITLIGMPGAGKSTVGVILAKVMGLRFLDSDLVIQEEEGCRLHELIEKFGTEGFLEIENKVNVGLSCENTVIATGGSVIYGEEAMAHLKEISTVVYLELDYETVASRLGDLRDRGVALKEGQSLKDLFEERRPLYEKYADVIVDADKSNAPSCMRAILRALEKEDRG